MATRLELQLLLRDIDNQIQRDIETVAQLRARIDAASEAQNPNQRAIATLNTQIATLSQSINGLRAERLSAQSQLASLSEQAAGQADVRRIDNATLPAAATAATAAAPQRVAQDDTATPVTTAQAASGEDGTNVSGYQIKPRPNKLDRFYSYTYQASVYMLTQQQYNALLQQKDPSLDGYFLLFQSGGAPLNQGGVRPPPQPPAQGDLPIDPQLTQPTNYGDGGRNPFFDNDFFIDSITLEHLIVGRGTRLSHANYALKFTVLEPNGMTLIPRLWEAAKNLNQKTEGQSVNYSSTEYLMVIKFYGYDEAGNLVTPIRSNEDGGGSDNSGAVIVKYIPFRVAKINWSVQSKGVAYEWEGVPVGLMMGASVGRGTVPADIQITATTVKQLLGSTITRATTPEPPETNPGQSTTPANPVSNARQGQNSSSAGNDRPGAQTSAAPPERAQAAPTPEYTGGLMGLLNQVQQELVRRGVYEKADEYEIEFIDGTNADERISEAKIQLDLEQVQRRTMPSGAPTAGPNGQTNNLNPAANPLNQVQRSFSITAGQSIVQAIDLAIRNSSYISNQSLVTIEPDGTQRPNPRPSGPMKWFSISFTATRLGFDNKRKDNAYRIKYTVKPYIMGNFNSKFFPPSKFRGIHKSYPYWFTGQNTAVLDFTETQNLLYSITVSGQENQKNQAEAAIRENWTSSLQDIVKYQYFPRSGESGAGGVGKEYEANANAAEIFYSPSDLARCRIKILGDPDWIQQGSLFKEYKPGTFQAEAITGFNPDGSIAFDAGDPMFEIVWQRPEDYDLTTGKADPYSGGYSGKEIKNRMPLQSRVYNAIKVVSEFHQGKFIQTLEGTLFLFPTPNLQNTMNAAAAAAGNAAAQDTGREANGTPRRGAPPSAADVQQQRARGFDPVGGAGEFGTNNNASSTATGAGGQLAAQSGSPAAASPNPTQEQLQQSETYKRAIARGLNQTRALALATNEWNNNASRSNGQAVGVSVTPAAGTLPEAAGTGGLSEQQRRQLAASQRQAQIQANQRQTGGSLNPTNARVQVIAKDE